MEYLGNMRRTNQIVALLGAAVLGSSAWAVPATELKENYQSIIERNPFGLKPPPPPQSDKLQEKEKPKTEIFLTGVTSAITVGYPKYPKIPTQAHFYTMEQGKKDPTYYSLSEGDSKDGIKITNIDPQQRKVRISMNNSDTVLSFETHGVKVAAAAARPGMPGQPNLPVPGQPNIPQPGAQPLPLPAAPNQGRTMYDANGQPTYQNPGGTAPAMNTGIQNTGTAREARQIPTRRIRGSGAPQNDVIAAPGTGGGAQPQEQPYRDPAEQYLRMHLNRAAQEKETGLPMPPLPTFGEQ